MAAAPEADWSGWLVDVHDARGRRVHVRPFADLQSDEIGKALWRDNFRGCCTQAERCSSMARRVSSREVQERTGNMATTPGVNPQFGYRIFSAEERSIIHKFSEYFYVTSALDVINIGNSQYRGFLMRPTDDMAILMNVEREIIVIFSAYNSFEARSLKAYDMAMESIEQRRPDPSVRFIVSGDELIDASIRNYLLKDPEYPVLIPFRYSEFASLNSSFILARIRSNHLIRDLFAYQSPLRSEYFYFGREALTGAVLDLHKSGQQSGVFGLRKSGKTSAIFAIQRRSKSASTRSILIDCQDTSVHDRSYSELLAYIVQELRKQLGLKQKSFDFGVRSSEVSDNFKVAIQQALSEAQSDVLVIFDEIENISPNTGASDHWKSGRDVLPFWHILRSHAQSSGKYHLTFLFVGTNPSILELSKINDLDNPVYLFAKKIYMPMLSEKDTKKMISRLGYFMGIDFPPEVSSYIHRLFGGHPFFTRQLCSEIHAQMGATRPVTASISICDRAKESASVSMRRYVADVLNSLRNFYPDEYAMLEYLANGKKDDFDEMVRYGPEYTEHLVGYGLIIKRGKDYDFTFDAVKEAIIDNVKPNNPEINNAGRWAEISRRRNALETEIRGVLFHWANKLDAQQWSEACEKCIPKIIEATGVKTPREVFSKNNSKLYFIDLLKFYKYGQISCGPRYEESEVHHAFGIINRLRIDAHANVIDDIEFQDWQNAIDLLEDIFMPPD